MSHRPLCVDNSPGYADVFNRIKETAPLKGVRGLGIETAPKRVFLQFSV